MVEWWQLGWFDLAYAALNINVIFYSFRTYVSTRQKPFQLLWLGLTCLFIANIVEMVNQVVFSEPYYVVVEDFSTIRMRVVSSYIHLGLYATFILLVLHAIQQFNSPRSEEFNDIPLILAGITFFIFSQLINEQAGIWLCGLGCDDPFYFPIAFMIAAIYGWWSGVYRYSFLVGFFSLPYMFSSSPPYLLLLTFITNFLGTTHYNLWEVLIFCAFGLVSGLIGMTSAKWKKHRSLK